MDSTHLTYVIPPISFVASLHQPIVMTIHLLSYYSTSDPSLYPTPSNHPMHYQIESYWHTINQLASTMYIGSLWVLLYLVIESSTT
jgi:hypothetical protein